MSNSPFLTSEEAAALLRMSTAALYKAVQRGQIPFIRRGKKALLFSESALLAHLTSRASSPQQER